ncbi:MAG TPA: 16S rRNA (uracil(1498)-N(3))-methyltransferase [Steroidobacteraceae bacterium]|nr:16S rRNA (uracil(1498)-N(3))-methyltransferase [Steroidobacteraceae bacterium]
MRVIRLHVEAALAEGARVTVEGPAAAHARRVLRLETGDSVTLFNGDGEDYASRIVGFGRGTLEAQVEGRRPARAESPLAVTLVQGLARGERMDLVVQKATELGIAAIVPVVTARSVVRLDRHTRGRKLAHWRGIAVAACEQCGRARIPAIAEPAPLTDYLRASGAGARLLLSPDAPQSLAAAARGLRSVEMLVGPEGGLEDGERESALAAGFRACVLGPRVLRSETAAIAALAVLQSVAGDLA